MLLQVLSQKEMVLSESVLLVRVCLGLANKAFIFGRHSGQSQIRLAFRASDKGATLLFQRLLGLSRLVAELGGLLPVNLSQYQLILRRSRFFASRIFEMA